MQQRRVLPATEYSHTQHAPLCLILYGSAVVCIAVALTTDDVVGTAIGIGVGLFIGLLAPTFHHLTVKDQGEFLDVHFGPVPLCRKAVRYSEIEDVEVGRTLILDGWGIHMSVRGGWVWNLWGRDCVVVHFKNGGTLRIGTDDAEHLASFLRSRLSD